MAVYKYIRTRTFTRCRQRESIRPPDRISFYPEVRLRDEGHLGKKRSTELLALHIPVSFNSFAHGMKGEECLATQ